MQILFAYLLFIALPASNIHYYWKYKYSLAAACKKEKIEFYLTLIVNNKKNI